ncbi:MAG: class I SAM-dependent methyltransferase [Candidatus Micrarchaeales archaeon]|jgi:ubiquinone/menaquinone biosynthesis C-methylase UbiE
MSTTRAGILGKRVKRYYSGFGIKEWRRLAKDPYHQIEFTTTMHFLKKYLPSKGHILDAGGGPGRYTIELAKRGYDVTLIDFTPTLLKIAKKQIKKAGVEKRVKQIAEASITDLLDFDDNSFDAVLCSGGPLSHILSKRDRQKAASELVRVARKGAPIFISVMSRFGVLTSELINFQNEIETSLFKRIRDTGDYPGNYGFTACHFFIPEDLKRLFEKKTRVIEMVAVEGLASSHLNEVNKLYKNKKRWKIWIETHLKTCNQPSILGSSEHTLLVGIKK